MLKKLILIALLFSLSIPAHAQRVDKPPLGVQINFGHPQAKGLVGMWVMNEGNGDKLNDLSGNGNDGTLTNMVPREDWVGGQNGYALDFDGTDNYVDLGTSLPSASNTVGTITAWIRYDSNPGSNYTRQIFAASDSGDALSEIAISVWNRSGAPTGPHLAGFVYEGGGEQFSSYGATLLTLGRWYHVAIVQDGITPKLYLDGVEGNTTIQSGNDQTAWFAAVTNIDFNAISISKRSNTIQTTRDWDGLIDDVRIYNRDLTAEEVLDIFQDPYALFRKPVPMPIAPTAVEAAIALAYAPITQPRLGQKPNFGHPLSKGLVGHWMMNEGVGSKVNDLSGNENTGTLTNMTPPTDWVGGRDGYALDFDGSDDYVDMNDIDSTGTKTFTMWINSADVSQSEVSFYLTNSGTESTDFITLGTFASTILASGDNENVDSAQSSAISSDTWHHIAVTKTAGDVTDIYVDGAQDTQSAAAFWSGSTAKSIIGGSWYSGTLAVPFDGKIDDVRVYNRALTPEEILQLASPPYAMFEETLMGSSIVAAEVAAGQVIRIMMW